MESFRLRISSVVVAILLLPWLSFAQSATALTYDASGNRIVKKVQGSSPNPTVTASPQAVNAGQPATLTATGCPGFIRWSTGQESNSISVSPMQTTEYIAECLTVGCANGSAKTKVDVIQCIGEEITASASASSVRYGQLVTLTAYGCTGTVQWSTGQVGNNALVRIYGPTSMITATCKKRTAPILARPA